MRFGLKVTSPTLYHQTTRDDLEQPRSLAGSTQTPSCDKTPYEANCLRFSLKVVEEKDGSTVYNVSYLHDATQEVMIYNTV